MRTFRALVATAALLTCGPAALPVVSGQTEDQPVAIVSIAPLERVTQDFNYLMKNCGAQSVGAFGTMMIKQWSDGLDMKRPAGVTVHLVDGQPVPLAFLPLEDRARFFTALEGAGQFADDLGDGLFAFDAGGQTIYAKDAGKWLFISQEEDDLADVPADPLPLLGDTPSKYDIGVRLFVQALPAEMRAMAIEQMKQGFDRSLAEQSGQSQEEKVAAEEFGKASLAQVEQWINETEQVLVGLATGPSVQRLQLDLGMQFLSGSELAAQSDKLKDLTSDLTGLLIEGAAGTFRFTSLISDSDKTVAKNNLKGGLIQLEKQIDDSGSLPAANKEALKKFSKGIASVIEKTIDSGKFDGGAALSLADGKIRAIIGGAVADGAQIEKEVKDLVASLGSGADIPKFQLGYGKHQDVNLHKVSLPIKSDDPEVQKLFGSELKLVIGTGAKAFFISVDPDGDSVIKSALDRMASAKGVKVSPSDMVLEVGQLVAFLQAFEGVPIPDGIAEQLAESPGQDKIRVHMSLVPRGGKYEIVVEEGVLKAIGRAVQYSQTGGQGF